MANVAKRVWTHKGEEKTAWTVRYVDKTGAHRQRTFDKKKDAELFRSRVEVDLSKNIGVAEKMTIGTVAEAFLRTMEERVKDGKIGRTHFKRCETSIRLHVLPYIKNERIDRVNLASLEAWFRDMKAASNLAPRTSLAAAQALKMVFDHAVKREWIFKNPVLSLLPELRGARIAEVKTFTTEQVQALLEAVNEPMYKGRTPDAAVRLQCAVHLATFCGLRLGEILGLCKQNIDFERGILMIRTSLSRHDGLKGPKSKAGNRDVAMPAHVAALLGVWLERYQVPNNRGNPNGLLFTYRDGKPMNQDGFRRGSWGPLLVRAGLSDDWEKPTFHFHALRHFAASWMIDNGWSLPDVAGALGHAKVDMTLSVYAHSLQKKVANTDQMQALSDRLMAPRPLEIEYRSN